MTEDEKQELFKKHARELVEKLSSFLSKEVDRLLKKGKEGITFECPFVMEVTTLLVVNAADYFSTKYSNTDKIYFRLLDNFIDGVTERLQQYKEYARKNRKNQSEKKKKGDLH